MTYDLFRRYPIYRESQNGWSGNLREPSGFLKRVKCFLTPDIFIKSSENNTPINSYHAPGGFLQSFRPRRWATPAMR
jgi:hypothetical protein